MKTKETKVISFRVPIELADRLEKQAKKSKKVRAKFVESLVLAALEIEQNKNQVALAA